MSRIIQKRKEKKRILWALLLLLISIIIVIGSSLALFSDMISVAISRKSRNPIYRNER